jgi:N-acetylglucosamine kinase-like BadF-type ATPase
MKFINKDGQSVALHKDQVQYDSIVSTCSNINFVGIDAFKKVLDDLFDNVYVDQSKIPFNEIITSCLLIGGFSGGSPANLKKVQEKLQLKGFSSDQLFLTSDAELSLELIKPTGIILISGTGSIAFGIEDNKKFRTGGFGKLLNDAGNGYSMGISAIRSALEYEHGYGDFTVLNQRIKEMYNVQKIYDLVTPIHSGEILQDKIALLSGEIFEHAKTDQVCQRIIQESVEHLVTLIIDTLKRIQSKDINVVLIGGIFNQGPFFIDQIISNNKLVGFLKETGKSIVIKDKSKDNIAFEVAKMILSKHC